tara:strand:+ start:1926 stop:2051 length:126 start_codon:yes stop_codon:yes gene_type:complete
MKHIRQISTPKADAFVDFYNALYRAWIDFRNGKKDEAQSGF